MVHALIGYVVGKPFVAIFAMALDATMQCLMVVEDMILIMKILMIIIIIIVIIIIMMILMILSRDDIPLGLRFH